MTVRATALLCASIAVALAGGCESPEAGLFRRFQDEDPFVRALAARQAGVSRNEKALAHLVDRLTDSEAEVRLFAIISLEKITGTRKGYRYYDPPAERRLAVQRWRSWLKSTSSNNPTTAPVEAGQ